MKERKNERKKEKRKIEKRKIVEIVERFNELCGSVTREEVASRVDTCIPAGSKAYRYAPRTP